MEKAALTALLKGEVIKRVYTRSDFRADQTCIELESGLTLQLTFEPPFLSFKAIKVTEKEIIDEDIYRLNVSENRFNNFI